MNHLNNVRDQRKLPKIWQPQNAQIFIFLYPDWACRVISLPRYHSTPFLTGAEVPVSPNQNSEFRFSYKLLFKSLNHELLTAGEKSKMHTPRCSKSLPQRFRSHRSANIPQNLYCKQKFAVERLQCKQMLDFQKSSTANSLQFNCKKETYGPKRQVVLRRHFHKPTTR